MDGSGGVFGSGKITCRWFNMPFMSKVVAAGHQVIAYGKVKESAGRLVIDHPELEVLREDDEDSETIHLARIVPIYKNISGINQRRLREIIHTLLQYDRPRFPLLPLPRLGKPAPRRSPRNPFSHLRRIRPHRPPPLRPRSLLHHPAQRRLAAHPLPRTQRPSPRKKDHPPQSLLRKPPLRSHQRPKTLHQGNHRRHAPAPPHEPPPPRRCRFRKNLRRPGRHAPRHRLRSRRRPHGPHPDPRRATLPNLPKTPRPPRHQHRPTNSQPQKGKEPRFRNRDNPSPHPTPVSHFSLLTRH